MKFSFHFTNRERSIYLIFECPKHYDLCFISSFMAMYSSIAIYMTSAQLVYWLFPFNFAHLIILFFKSWKIIINFLKSSLSSI